MTEEYTEQDTDRARERERSSAGMKTQTLTAPPREPGSLYGAPVAGVPGRSRRGNIPALALIGIGVLMLLGQLFPGRIELTGGMVLLTIASCFFFFSFWQRIYGLLIPACILAGLSIGVPFSDITNGVSVLWGLSTGFLAILFLGRALFGVNNNWPVFPAVPLFAFGVIVAVTNLPGFIAGGLVWLPLLIAVGLFLGWGKRARAGDTSGR